MKKNLFPTSSTSSVTAIMGENSDSKHIAMSGNDHVETIDALPAEKKPCPIAWRYVTAALGFYAMFTSYALRSHLSVTMVAMVNSSSSSGQSTECGGSNKTSSNDNGGPFNWDSETQGILFGGFYWGYIIPQIFGGRMADKYGPKLVAFIGGLIGTLATAIGPWAANTNVWFFFATRFVCGLGLAVFTPCMHALIAKWTPPYERSRLAAVMYSGGQFGIIISMPVSGALCANAPNGGWPWPFYVFTITSAVWLLLWLIFVSDTPAEHKWISRSEREFIEGKLSHCLDEKEPKTPYKELATSKAFCGLVWTHFGQNWGYYTLLTQIPTYMSDILHFNIQQNGLLSAIPYVVLMIFGYCCSFLADFLIKRNKLSVTNVRKTFQSIALYGTTVSLLIITFLNCQTSAIYALLILAVGFDGGIYAGFQVNHIDLSPNFAGTLQGITNTVASIPGIVSPYITGIVTNNSNTQAGWSIIFYITCAILVVTATQYIIFGSGELQYWNNIDNPPKRGFSYNSNGQTKSKFEDRAFEIKSVEISGK